MELRQLEYFLAIARHGNMTAAANELHVSQPSLSVSLKKLEEELGAPLFDRDGRRLVLNDNGLYFADQTESIKSIIAEARHTIESGNAKRSSTVNLALKTPLGNPGALMGGFYERHPDYNVRLGWADSELFEHETIDLEVFSTPLELDDQNVILLGTEDYVAALPLDHRLAEQDAIRLADLKDDPFIFSSGWRTRTCFNAHDLCVQAGFEPKVACETQWYTDAMAMVVAGIGCCLAGRISWLAGSHYRCKVATISDVHRTRHIYLRLSDSKPPTATTWAFVDYLQDYLDPLFDECEKARKLYTE